MAQDPSRPRSVFLFAHGIEPAPVRASNLEDALAKFLYNMEKPVRDWHEMTPREAAEDFEKTLRKLGFGFDDSAVRAELTWRKV